MRDLMFMLAPVTLIIYFVSTRTNSPHLSVGRADSFIKSRTNSACFETALVWPNCVGGRSFAGA
jgi:hypothetical protein